MDEKEIARESVTSHDPALVYFTGVDPQGKYLVPPVPLEQVGERLLEKGWQAPPDWVLEWTREHAVDDPLR